MSDTARARRTEAPGDTYAGGPTPMAVDDVAALEADIERTREDLADAVDELTARLDVRAHLRDRAVGARRAAGDRLRRLRDLATDDSGTPSPGARATAVVVVVGGAAVTAAAWWRRRRAMGRSWRS